MNIWYISAYDAPQNNSSRTYDFARHLVERGHTVTFFTSSFDHFSRVERLGPLEKSREETVDGIRVVWLKTIPYHSIAMRFVNMLSNAWRAYVVGSAKNERPDLIVGPSVPLFTGLTAYLLSQNKRCAFCFEVRDIWPQALVDLGLLSPRSPITWVLSVIERFLYRRSDRIIAVLPFAYRHISQHGVRADKVAWIPNGVDLRRFLNVSHYDGGKADALHVLYVAGFSTAHSVETLLEAANILRERDTPSIRFTIVGGGSREAHFRNLSEELKLSTVAFVGAVSKEEIPEMLSQADVLVVSVKRAAVYQFGINFNKIFEYLAAGRPIIFAGESPNDPVSDAQAGISIPPEDSALLADAIQQIFNMGPRSRKEKGENGLAYAREHFDIKVLAAKLENEFSLAIAASKKRGQTNVAPLRGRPDHPRFDS